MSTLQYPPKNNIKALEIPEIVDRIAKYLRSREFMTCIKVSKDWHQTFIAYLWEDLKFYDLQDNPPASSIVQHAHLIRNIVISGEVPPGVSTTHFPYLGSIQFLTSHFSQSKFSPILLTNNPTIENLTMRVATYIPEFWDTVSKLPNLREIFISDVFVQPETVEAFWDTLCHMEKVTFENIKFTSNLTFPSTVPSKLKDLTLRDISIAGQNQLDVMENYTHMEASQYNQLDLITRCTQLQSLEWSLRLIDNCRHYIGPFCKSLSQGTWPYLHKLKIGNFYSMREMDMEQILCSISRLTALAVDERVWGPTSFNAFVRHFDTLEVLSTQTDRTNFTSAMANTVLCSCPNLIELKSPSINGLDIINGVRINQQDHPDHKWICNQLRILYIKVNLDGCLDSELSIVRRMADLPNLTKLIIRFRSPSHRSQSFFNCHNRKEVVQSINLTIAQLSGVSNNKQGNTQDRVTLGG
ncbi:hypothetical protein BGZ76_005829 [Entomortierella beljakovae]|nr:hypothetical protein BGZ76_005829 [Entomortierella beljakovae]